MSDPKFDFTKEIALDYAPDMDIKEIRNNLLNQGAERSLTFIMVS
jgi:hypothetical protein